MGGVILFLGFRIVVEPVNKRAIAFFDGQNLFNSAKRAFGSNYPDYDPVALAKCVCQAQEWQLQQVRFYTGIPDAGRDLGRHTFWANKLAAIGRQGGYTFSRKLRYVSQTVKLADGTEQTAEVAQEKGIDVRLALDVVTLAIDEAYDVALLFTQDQDLSEVVDEIKRLARKQSRWIRLACAYPSGGRNSPRGVNGTDWIKIDEPTYQSCIDPNYYR